MHCTVPKLLPNFLAIRRRPRLPDIIISGGIFRAARPSIILNALPLLNYAAKFFILP